MGNYNISVILPRVTDEDKLVCWMNNVFSQDAEVEALICEKIDPEKLSSLEESVLARVKVFPSQDKGNAVKKAISDAGGDYILFSDVGISYSSDAFAAMLARGACTFNGSGVVGNLFSADYCFDEIASKNGYFCCMMNTETVQKNQILPVSGTSFSLMNMIADYARYDEIKTIHETLLNISAVPEASAGAEDIASLESYSWLFSQTASDKVTLFYIRNVMAVFGSCEQKESFEMLRSVLLPFMGDYAVCAWFKEVYGWDAELLKTDIRIEDFRRMATNVGYTEIVMPLKAEDAVTSFYSGKFSAADLKRCIFAYVYFKAYRMKPGFFRDKLCELCRRKLGGDFNG
ncbi:MAG TPA: hypothetical protein DCY15_09230 [Ruminococcaceae bacterium]|nr:hypothetical protein [Oscillospiraceae bacterium]